MDERRGTFIVVEGTDGAGKSTQFALLKKRLEDAGHSVATFKFPQYDQPSSYFVQRYLGGEYGKVDEVGPYTSSLFYALDRFEAAPAIRQALIEGKIVLCDRFTGSNMAHQGTKIPRAEERRGFFIWLDNLEFEMLRIPRPDISFVLRMPAEAAQELLATKEDKDIHEKDLPHLQRTVSVYDDLTQLFPKDFKRIDCIRSGTMLDIPTVNNILWEQIAPLLPAPATTKSAKTKKQAAAVKKPALTQEVPADEPALSYFELLGASELLIQKIERLVREVEVAYASMPSVYVPRNLNGKLTETYQSEMEKTLAAYGKIIQGLAVRGATPAEARAAARSVLPVATTATIRVPNTTPNLEDAIAILLNDPLPEIQAAGATLMAQIIKHDPKLFAKGKKPTKLAAPTAVRALASEFLTEQYAAEQESVQLVGVWPRNEIDIVADMLYEHSGLSLRDIQLQIASWPLNRKLAVFEAYTGDAHPGRALQKVHYSWDFVCPYTIFRTLQGQPAEALESQTLTPRYGYDISKIIDDAGLSDLAEDCFDRSLTLNSALQQAGFTNEAQYATLQGHKQRWKATYNADQFIQLALQTTDPEARLFLAQIRQKLSEAHPTLGEILS